MHIDIKSEHLRALTHLAAKTDVRKNINGVWIEASRNTILIAMSGPGLGAIDTGVEASERFAVMVPHGILDRLKKVKGDVTFSSDDGKKWTATHLSETLAWFDDGLKLLDWRRVLPRSASGEAAHLDLGLLDSFVKAAKDLTRARTPSLCVLIGHNGEGTSLIHFAGQPKFIGGLMPRRLGAIKPGSLLSAPAWATHAPLRGAPATVEVECDLA